MLPSGRTRTKPEMSPEFARLRTRIMRILFAIGFVCNVWFWFYDSYQGIISARNATLTDPLLVLICAVGFIVTDISERWRIVAERSLFLAFCIGCATGVFTFGDPDPQIRLYVIADTLQWLPLISVAAFIIFPGRESIPAAVIGFLIPAATAVWVWFNSEPANWPDTTNALLLNAIIVQAISLLVLVLFSYSQAAYQQAKAQASMMESAALSDPLTGIANRRGIERALEIQGASSRQWALILLDMDYFKTVNDQWGHVFGDRVLQNVVDALRRVLREGDVIGRWGGDEFLVVSADLSAPEAEALAETLRQAVAALPDDESGGVTISAGVALWDGEGGLAAALRLVDAALYRSKQMGRNRVVFA